MAYVIQEIFEPIVFYPNTSFTGAKRYKRKANAEKIISNYSEHSYLIIEEEKVGTKEHENLFMQKRILIEKKRDEFQRSKYPDCKFPIITDSDFYNLAETVWRHFLEELNYG